MIAVFGSCAIAQGPLSRRWPIKAQFLACRTEVEITLCLIVELVSTQELGAVIHIGKRDVGPNALSFDGDQIVFGAILLVTGDLSRPQFPAKARAPEQSAQRLIVHHFPRRHQDVQDDARFASIDD